MRRRRREDKEIGRDRRNTKLEGEKNKEGDIEEEEENESEMVEEEVESEVFEEVVEERSAMTRFRAMLTAARREA